MTGDRRQATGDRWQVTGERWPLTGDRWQVTGDKWHVVGDRWQVTHEPWHMTIFYRCYFFTSWVSFLRMRDLSRIGGMTFLQFTQYGQRVCLPNNINYFNYLWGWEDISLYRLYRLYSTIWEDISFYRPGDWEGPITFSGEGLDGLGSLGSKV